METLSTLRSHIGLVLLVWLVAAPVMAVRAGDSCHDMAVSGEVDPQMFSAMCAGKKDDLALVCGNQVKKMGPDSQENVLVRHFIVPKGLCTDKKSLQSFCGFAQSYEGFMTLSNDGSLRPDPSDPDYASLKNPRDRAAKVCGTTPEAVHASLCSKADAAKHWEFAMAECPVEGRAIYIRECQKPTTTSGEGAGKVIQRTAAECAQWFDSGKIKTR